MHVGIDIEGYYPLKGEIEDLIILDRVIDENEIRTLSSMCDKTP